MSEYKEVNTKVYLTEENMKIAKEITEIKKQRGYAAYKVEDAVRDILLVGLNDRFSENAKLLIQVEDWNNSK